MVFGVVARSDWTGEDSVDDVGCLEEFWESGVAERERLELLSWQKFEGEDGYMARGG